ncbi:hypothetical protein [Bifidobacterium vansinderenii]|uniref:Uncharacterized protein n=1 Tax=Bifidobacterium vansinderenii TaxID=1984871 RepID=A0A229VW34_9BIFI|nr:hypothetical protein [Bifidobacterium vansinderenii]OXM99830.1 hypothetical protein Tam10B_1923 [Bifidobacterium vansinderenii]
MANVERASYRAVLKPGIDSAALDRALREASDRAQTMVDDGTLLTAGLYRHGEQLFLYTEHIYEGDRPDLESIRVAPDTWGWLHGLLRPFPAMRGRDVEDVEWAYMHPVFWFDEPKSVDYYTRRPAPDARCGRIAVLYPDKLMEYVCHHQAIVREGTFVGDRYQFISIHDNMLFSYFETPRDRGRQSISGADGPSREIEEWIAVDPASHFNHFPEANGSDFLVIDTLFDFGRSSSRGEES